MEAYKLLATSKISFFQNGAIIQENRFLLESFSLDINSQNLFRILQGEMLHDPYDHFTLTSSSYKKFKKIAKQKKASIDSIELSDFFSLF